MRKPGQKLRDGSRRASVRLLRPDVAGIAQAQSRVWFRFRSGNDYFDLMSFAERCILADPSSGFANPPIRKFGNS